MATECVNHALLLWLHGLSMPHGEPWHAMLAGWVRGISAIPPLPLGAFPARRRFTQRVSCMSFMYRMQSLGRNARTAACLKIECDPSDPRSSRANIQDQDPAQSTSLVSNVQPEKETETTADDDQAALVLLEGSLVCCAKPARERSKVEKQERTVYRWISPQRNGKGEACTVIKFRGKPCADLSL